MEAPLMFEVLMYLNSYYFGMFSIFEFSVIWAKSIDESQKKNPYMDEFGTNMTIFVFLCLIEVFRTFLSRRDNAADKAICVVLSLILTVPSAAGVLYFLLWQKKTFRLEYILGCIQLVLQATQVFFGIVSLLTFKSSDSTTWSCNLKTIDSYFLLYIKIFAFLFNKTITFICLYFECCMIENFFWSYTKTTIETDK